MIMSFHPRGMGLLLTVFLTIDDETDKERRPVERYGHIPDAKSASIRGNDQRKTRLSDIGLGQERERSSRRTEEHFDTISLFPEVA